MTDMFSLLEKIAAEDLLSKAEKKKKEEAESGKRGVLARLTTGAAGTAMATSSVPLVAKSLSPSPLVYHGTDAATADKIFNLPVNRTDGGPTRGLLTQFAGRAGRLNEKLLANAVVRAAEDAGVELSNDDITDYVYSTGYKLHLASQASKNPERRVEQSLKDELYNIYRAQSQHAKKRVPWGDPGRDAWEAEEARLDALEEGLKNPDLRAARKAGMVQDLRGNIAYDSGKIVREGAEELLRSKGVTGERLDNVMKGMDETLRQYGKRIYFGWHPSTVAVWGRAGNELELAGQKMIGEFADSAEGKRALDAIPATIQKYMPPGMKVPPIPIKELDQLDDVSGFVKKWLLTDIVQAAIEQIGANVNSGMPLEKAVGTLPQALGVEDLRNLQGLEDVIKKGRIPDKSPLADDLADLGNELASAAKSFYAKKTLKGIGRTLTFGIVDEAKQLKNVAAYRPSVTRDVTIDEAGKILKEVAARPDKPQVVIGARIPGGSLRWMNDFPFLSSLMGINPGLKHTVSDFLPNFDPARDMSIPDDVPIENFRTVDIVDRNTGNVERLRLKDVSLPKFSPGRYARGLGVVAPAALIGAMGLDLAQSAIRNKKTYAERLISGDLQLRPSKKDPSVKRWQSSKVAAASPARDLALWTAKKVAPAALGGMAIGAGADYAINQVMPASAAKDMPEPRRSLYLGQRAAAAGTAASLLGMGLPALMASRSLSGQMSRFRKLVRGGATGDALEEFTREGGLKPVMGALGLAMLTGQVASTTAGMTDTARRGIPAQALSPLNLPLAHPKGKKLVEKHPVTAALPTALTLAAVPVLGAYAGRRYYPGHFLRAERFLRNPLNFENSMVPALERTADFAKRRNIPHEDLVWEINWAKRRNK